jgi:hypothetical protein
MRTLRRIFVAGTLVSLALGLPLLAHRGATGGTVYLAHGLPDEELIVLGAALAGSDDAVLLLDSDGASAGLRQFLRDYRPARLVAVGHFPGGADGVERRLGLRPETVLPWTPAAPRQIWRTLLPRPDSVVVCPAAPRRLFLQAACLAGAARAPLLVARGNDVDAPALRQLLADCGATWVYLLGDATRLEPTLAGVRHACLKSEDAVVATYRRLLTSGGAVETAVVANPADTNAGKKGLSSLAPWLAVQKHAALLLCGSDGGDVEAVVAGAAERESLRHLDNLILMADLHSIPWRHRPNPVPGKDEEIEMEPLTPAGVGPFSFAVGRLFHQDRAVVPLTLARQRLLPDLSGPRRALVASNPGGGLSLLETFSRGTAAQLQNAGYRTTARFGDDVHPGELRRLLPQQHVFLWEGHHNTLINEWGFATWDEPLLPSLVFLQSCLALAEPKAGPLLQRGAVAVVGTSTRTYSGSGGACSMAFFDALLYDGRPLGGALRQAKNFLLACTLLKEKRLGKDAAHKGAGLRAAWAFTLWGDPTLRLPPPQPQTATRPPVRHEVTGNTLVLTLPPGSPDRVQSDRYAALLWPNARMAGLVRKELTGDDDERRQVVPLVFAEVHLPRGRPGQVPRLTSRLPSTHWVFCWDGRRRSGYLLATPRPQDTGELRFRVHWEPAQTARAAQASSAGGR